MPTDEQEPEQDDPITIRAPFERPPRPYHQGSLSTTRPQRLNLAQTNDSTSGPSSPNTSVILVTSSSDSGTEADDEKPLLKALTAPPLRPRKGLKSSNSYDGTSNPSLRQLRNDGETNPLLEGHAASIRQKSNRTKSTTSSSVQRHQRKPIEVLRRLFEVTLFSVVAWVSLRTVPPFAASAFWWHAILVLLLYATYIPQLLVRLFLSRQPGQLWLRIWFSESADPAPLLYPVFLPLLVIYSLSSEDNDAVLAYILSICAIPRSIVPLTSFYTHWLLTLTPLLTERIPSLTINSSLSREEIVLLFPLHCALMQTLYFLSTSSLLTTELQLSSIALINLLGTPKTPQSSILKALLWIGGLGMLIFCRHVLKLSVELARIPTWRLRRVRRASKHDSVIYCALDDLLGGLLSSTIFPAKHIDTSDDDFDHLQSRLQNQPSLHQTGHQTKLSSRKTTMDDLGTRTSNETSRLPRTLRRRHTLPGSLAVLPDIPTITKTATDALSSARTRSKLILRLTLPQAIVLKWLYAIFTYIMVVLIILLPIRLYVQYYALDKQEPIGWALGYLLGDIQWFRMQVVLSNLDLWIRLPLRDTDLSTSVIGVDHIRETVLGTANTRLLICVWCIGWITIGLTTVLHLSSIVEVDTRRKVFHGMMVAMFLPTIFIDPAFIALAFILILAIFLLLDLFRASQLPPLSKPLTYFLAPYVDGRDHKGPIIISHIFLLIGCAIPLWLSLAAVDRTGEGPAKGWEVPTRDLSMVTGVICVGMGDAAASLIGRRYGRRRWPWSGGKSLEGSAAFAIAVVLGLVVSRFWLVMGEWQGGSEDAWLITWQKSAAAAVGASLTEAVLTGGNDNVVVPVILWLLTRGLSI